jgi:hypothetical protein
MILRYALLGLAACSLWLGAQAQQSLSDLVNEANAGWMLGKWEASTDDGSTVGLEFSWDLDKHVIVMHGKLPDSEFKGYSALDPASHEVKYVGFDTRGTLSKGTWGLEGGELTLRVESQSADRTIKMGAVFTGSASEPLQLRVHRIDDSGNLASPARMTLKFKKK